MTSTPILPLCQSRLLSAVPGVVHGITRRVEGLGNAHGNVGYSHPRDPDDAWEMRGLWCDALGLDRSRLTGLHQVHGAEVVIAGAAESGRGAAPGSDPTPKADALITQGRGVVLQTLHADCMPVILCDPVAQAVATVHAGWRGTTLDVAGATIAAMIDAFGAKAERMIAFLGPAIGGGCYEVGADVLEAWSRQAGSQASLAIKPHLNHWLFDLDAANRWLLRRAGLLDRHVESSGICTKCGGDQWFSHRGQGPLTGRYASIVALV